MKKQTVEKIMGKIIIFTFAIFFIQVVLPLPIAFAATPSLDYSNPNKNGDNPYKFKTGDVLNSQMIMQVVGCTGVVDKVSSKITDFAKDTVAAFLTKELKAAAKVVVVKVAKVLGITAVASVPGTVSGNLTDIPKEIPTGEIQNVKDAAAANELKAIKENAAATKKREECFNGIAVTLARNQLTAMTRYTMNWVNTGFNGDPMYVRDITSFTNGLEKNVIETGVRILTSPDRAYPYGADFSRSAINGYNSGSSLRSGAGNFLNSLTSDLSNFITDPRSYYSENALEKANSSNDAFANDFSTGGWDGWLALTQRDQNNPLGFSMKASEYLEDQQISQTETAKAELATNGGFLSQKKCVLWELYDDDNSPIYEIATDEIDPFTIKTSTSPGTLPNNNKCVKYETTTPGSLIKDKVSEYVNSPERQLELVKTINDSLNSLFTALISKFQNEGLSSLGSNDNNFTSTDILGGYGSNDLFGNDSFSVKGLGLDNPSDSSSGGGYTDGSFNLTRDLGNTFYHTYQRAGSPTWDAYNNNLISNGKVLAGRELKMGLAPTDSKGTPLGSNVYYVVSTAGNTIIVSNGSNKWQVGDRAFWNGTEWQNWKKGTTDPIKKRGVLQIQKDYIVAAKQLLTTLPTIMPKMGELDYCIPGPNPNWRTTAATAEASFTKLAGTMASQPTTRYECNTSKAFGVRLWKELPGFSSTHKTYKTCIQVLTGYIEDSRPYTSGYDFATAGPESDEYKEYQSIFTGTNASIFDSIMDGSYWTAFNTSHPAGNIIIPEGTPEHTTPDQVVINDAVKKVGEDVKKFYYNYTQFVNETYGSATKNDGTAGMLKEFTENEQTGALTPNPTFLPMAAEGLDVTKDIVSYEEDINKTKAEYEDGIVKANANINKLETIKAEVSKIIKAAQDRRLAKLLADAENAGLTEAQYRATYASCLDQEDITFEDLTIAKDVGTERCNDNMDNDLDGLVDYQDSDCHESSVQCSDGVDNDLDGLIDGNDPDCQ